MVVNGVPVRKDRHVEPVAAMALDILDSVRELRHPTSKRLLTVSIGELPTSIGESDLLKFGVNGIYEQTIQEGSAV